MGRTGAKFGAAMSAVDNLSYTKLLQKTCSNFSLSRLANPSPAENKKISTNKREILSTS